MLPLMNALLRQQNNFKWDIASRVGFKISFQIHILYNTAKKYVLKTLNLSFQSFPLTSKANKLVQSIAQYKQSSAG